MNNNKVKNNINRRALLKLLLFITFLLKRRIKDNENKNIGTIFKPKVSRVESRKRWILTGRSEKKGKLFIDDGAYEAVKNGGNSLLPAGIQNIIGDFYRGDIVEINKNEHILGWGITSYSSKDIMIIKGKQSSEIHKLLSDFYGEEIIHRNNMVIA